MLVWFFHCWWQHQYVDLFQNFNVNDIAENAPTTLLFTTTSFRMLNFYRNRTRYVNLTKEMSKNVCNLQKYGDQKTKQIISDSVKYMRRLTILFWISALITGNLMCIKSAFDAIVFQFDASKSAVGISVSISLLKSNYNLIIELNYIDAIDSAKLFSIWWWPK